MTPLKSIKFPENSLRVEVILLLFIIIIYLSLLLFLAKLVIYF